MSSKRRKLYLEPDKTYLIPRTTQISREQHQLENKESVSTDACHQEIVSPGVGDDENLFVTKEAFDEVRSEDESYDFPNDYDSNVSEKSFTTISSVSDITEHEFVSEITSSEFESTDMEDDDTGINTDLGFTINDIFSDNRAIFEGSNISRKELLLLILWLSIENNLTAKTTCKVFSLFNLILGDEILPNSPYQFNKIYAAFLQDVQLHIYCNFCTKYAGMCTYNESQKFKCLECKKEVFLDTSEGNFFALVPLSKQVRPFLESLSPEELNYRSKLSDGNFEDIMSGFQYIKMHEENKLGPYDFTFSFNADGFPLFKSSKTSVWPVQIILNELPPKLRFKNVFLGGLWCGKGKPNLDVLLKHFTMECNKLQTVGVQWQIKTGEIVKSKLYPTCATVDSVARCSMQGFVQFNGYFGCFKCEHPGVSEGKVMKYPMTKKIYKYRTQESYLAQVEEAFNTRSIVHGVKHASPLINMRNFNIINGFVPDYMHALCLGISRQFLGDLWLTSPHAEYYIGNAATMKMLTNRLCSFTPSKSIGRLPRSVEEWKYWKASEWRNWLLYFSLPTLEGVLPQKYLKHWSHLVRGSFLLLQTRPSREDLLQADEEMLEFVCGVQSLYTVRSMTYNVHLLLHMAEAVRDWGALWAQSCYPFENAIGELKKFVKGSKGLGKQIIEKKILKTLLPAIVRDSVSNPSVLAFCSNRPDELRVTFTRDTVKLVGRGVASELAENELKTCRETTGIMVPKKPTIFNRFITIGQIILTSNYKRSHRTRDHIVQLTDGSIGKALKVVQLGDVLLLLMSAFKIVGKAKFGKGPEMPHIYEIEKKNPKMVVAVLASQVKEKCIYIKCRNRKYACIRPNMVEYG